MNDFTPIKYFDTTNNLQNQLTQAMATMLSMQQTIEVQNKLIEVQENQINFLSNYIEKHTDNSNIEWE